MRRAAELASVDPDAQDRGLSREEVLRIGKEVGLPEEHVRRALSEVRTGRALTVRRRGGALKALFSPSAVWGSRVIDRSRDTVSAELDNFLVAGRLLQPVRRGKEVLQYRPAVDWVSRVARAASSTSRQHYIAAARMVEVRLDEIGPDRTRVEIVVDPGVRNDHQAGAIMGGGAAGIASGLGSAALIAAAVPGALAIASGAAVGVVVTLGVATVVGRAYSRRCDEVHSEIEGVLDSLELGQGLEPPPPSWRRWVKRHFHGVARDLFGDGDL